MPRHLNATEKAKIVTLLEEGWSERRVAQKFQAPKSIVHDIKIKWMETDSLERKEGTGLKRASTNEHNNNLIQ